MTGDFRWVWFENGKLFAWPCIQCGLSEKVQDKQYEHYADSSFLWTLQYIQTLQTIQYTWKFRSLQYKHFEHYSTNITKIVVGTSCCQLFLIQRLKGHISSQSFPSQTTSYPCCILSPSLPVLPDTISLSSNVFDLMASYKIEIPHKNTFWANRVSCLFWKCKLFEPENFSSATECKVKMPSDSDR